MPTRRQFFTHTAATAATLTLASSAQQPILPPAVTDPKKSDKDLKASKRQPAIWIGATTSDAATVRAWVKPGLEKPTLRLTLETGDKKAEQAAAKNAGLVFQGQRTVADQPEVVTFHLTGLSPDTAYVGEIEGTSLPRAHVRTFPPHGKATSFSFAFSSCAKTGSENEVFRRIAKKQPLLFLHLGDLHYENIKDNKPSKFRDAWQRVLSSSAQAELYRRTNLAYVWDDHDFGPNGSDKNSPSKPASRQVYREMMPHYPLGLGTGDVPICQTFDVARCRFILTDCRSERDSEKADDGPEKSMLGAVQKKWLFDQFKKAKADGVGLIFWGSSVPYIGNDPKKGDGWARFAYERREIATFLKGEGIKNICILCGDAHMIAADDGTNSDYAIGGGVPVPVLHGSALDQTPSRKGGPYSKGIYNANVAKREGCFGWVEITDDGENIRVAFSGRTQDDKTRIALDFSVPPKA